MALGLTAVVYTSLNLDEYNKYHGGGHRDSPILAIDRVSFEIAIVISSDGEIIVRLDDGTTAVLINGRGMIERGVWVPAGKAIEVIVVSPKGSNRLPESIHEVLPDSYSTTNFPRPIISFPFSI